MARVELKDTLLGTDIINVINKGCGLDNNFRCKITINTKGVKSSIEEYGNVDSIEIKYLHRIDIIRNFIGAYTDNFIVYGGMPAGEYVKFILSQRDMIECDMEIKILDENGDIQEFTWKMRGFILDVGGFDKSDKLFNNISIEDLNNVAMINFKLQLIYREVEAMRGGSTGLFVKNITRDDAVYGIISNWLNTTKPKIDGEPMDMVVKFLESKEEQELDNLDELTEIIEVNDSKISKRPNLLNFPTVFQKKYGLYTTGCNNYVHKPMKTEFKEEKGCVYSIYPTIPGKLRIGNRTIDGEEIPYSVLNLDEVKNYEKELEEDEVVVLISSSNELLDNNPYVYGKEGKVLYIVPKSSGVKATDVSKETTITSVSADFGTKPCDVNRAGIKHTKDSSVVDNTKNVKQTNLVSSKSGEVANINVITSGNSVSLLELASTNLANQATSFSFEWQFGNPFIIKPYNRCTVKTVNKNDSILEYFGRITTLFFTYDFSTRHTSTIVTFSGYVSDYIKGEV